MLREKIEQLKRLLGEMANPNRLEYQRITAEFNKYRDVYNLNTKPRKISHENLMYFLADKFRNFEFQRQLRNGSRNSDIGISTGAVVSGLFYEMVATIKRFDTEGWDSVEFDITDEEMHILKEHRNTLFHVPDDVEKFMERWDKVKSLNERLSEITYKNSGALLRYMFIQREKYPVIDEMLETAFKPSREPNFLWNNYKSQ